MQGKLELQRGVSRLVLSDDPGAVRGHPARIIAVLPSAVAGNDGDRQATAWILATPLFIDHGRFPVE